MNETILFAVILLGMLGFGLVVVFSVLNLRDQWKQKRELGGEAEAVRATPGRSTEGDVPDAVEVMRLLRDRFTGELWIEIGGKRYKRPAEIHDANVWHGLATVQRDLSGWKQNSAPPPNPPATSETTIPAAGGSVPPPAGPPPPNMNPFDQMKVLRERAKAAVGPDRPMTVVEQIDEILQRRLAGTPYESIGVWMRPSASGGVVIVIGGRDYESVDAVPDPGIRAVIRESVKEWESRGG